MASIDDTPADCLAPSQELAHCLRVGAASLAVADVGGEEFDEALLRAAAGGDDKGRETSAEREGTSWFVNFTSLATTVSHAARPL
jgi:hypothetical protein